MEHIIAIDEGTTSTRALIINQSGAIKAIGQQPLTLLTPKPNFVEQDAEEIWQATYKAIHLALGEAHLQARDISGIAITNQRETTVLWHKITGEVVAPAIVWQDSRTYEYCEQLKEKIGNGKIQELTGLVFSPYFSASKIRWILDHNPEAQALYDQEQLCFGTIDSFLLYRLTQGKSHKTCITNASRTQLMNIQDHIWDQELLDIFELKPHILPTICPNIDNFGTAFIGETPVPIVAMIGDQQSAMVGQHCFKTGSCKTTLGTGAFLMYQCGLKRPNHRESLLTTIAFDIGEGVHYGLEGSIFMAGSILQWLRDQLQILNHVRESHRIATQIGYDNHVMLIPAFVGLGAPYWRSDVSASIENLTYDSNKNHIINAGLQAIALQISDILGLLPSPPTQIAYDGGMCENKWLMQALADFTGSHVKMSEQKEATAMGAAFLAGLSLHWWKQFEDLPTTPSVELKPIPFNRDVVEEQKVRWKKCISAKLDL